MKVIPAIDLMSGQVVRLYKGDPNQKTVYSDDPISIIKKWEDAGADMIHLVDLDATLGLGSNFELIKKIVSSVSVPVEIAGGLRSESLILEALKIVDRVVIGTFAFKEPELLQNLLTKLGPEKIVISVDHKDGIIVTHGWQDTTDISLIVSRCSSEAVMSRNTSSSAPSLLYLAASSTGSPASLMDSKFNPLTTLPFFTSKQGMILLVKVMLISCSPVS